MRRNGKRKLAIVATHPIQYQAPIWRALAGRPELDIHVYFGSDFSVRGYHDPGFGTTFKWDVPLLEGYPHTFLSTDMRVSGVDDFFALRASGLGSHLRAFSPDCALINAYMPFFWWEAFGTLRLMGIPILFRAEASDTALPRSFPKRFIRSILLKSFYKRCVRCLAIGENARRHYLAHGVPPRRIGWAPYCVDNGLFEEQVSRYRPQRDSLRKEMGFEESDTVFIYSGKLIDKKGPLTLARALRSMSDSERRRIGLVVLGDGVLRPRFEAECKIILGPRCIFAGFVNQSRIGVFYAASDCLVLPSTWGETWGLVVNEAMQFGLPAIVSDRVGCQPDLVVEGETGYVFPADNADRLRSCMLTIKEMPHNFRDTLFRQCRSKVGGYTVQQAVEGIRCAVLDL